MTIARSRARVISGLVGVAAVIALIAIGPVGPARAAPTTGDVDQITGNGNTSSVLTVPWSQGLLGADNRTVVKPREPSSPLSFMYDDFKNLKVTVSQTDSLVHQAIKVTWSGGKPTGSQFQGDYLQMMQCYGDADAGPDAENCQFGSQGLLPGGSVLNRFVGSRTGKLCAPGATPSTDPARTPGTHDGSSPVLGCDTQEPGGNPSHVLPDDPDDYNIPFIPVGTTNKIYGPAPDYYDQFNSNEVQEANTGSDGTGQYFFQTLTSTEAPGLGCGAVQGNGSARGCWLVIVPRGEYKANGYKINIGDSTTISFLNDSPLGASNWEQRIQIHLNFAPIPNNCPIGSADERQMVGTGLIAQAVFSWQLALNAAAKCRTIYGFSATPESTNTSQLTAKGGIGLAFTTIPIGSEAGRLNGGGPGDLGVPLVYAPVGISAVTFAFNINLSTGYIATPVKLTPRLMAKALTQSYKKDLSDFDNNHPGLAWAKNNPETIVKDPEFQKLNPNVPKSIGSGSPTAPLLTEDHSALNQQVGAWIQSDKAARDWLAGKPDENGMVVNPNYKALKLNNPPAIDSYPRADPTCFDYGKTNDSPPKEMIKCALDQLPYVNGFDEGAALVRAANNPEGANWDPLKLAPDGSTGWWGNGGVEPAGSTFMWAVTDSASLTNHGLVPADLCDASGNHCVGADTASVTTALGAAKADSTGLLHINPAHPGSGAYPLVDVTYAAVRTEQSAPALQAYAALINYAAGQGQTPGVSPGQLPHGYLPMPQALRDKAKAAAATLLGGNQSTPPGGGSVPGGGSLGGGIGAAGGQPGILPNGSGNGSGGLGTGGGGAGASNPGGTAGPSSGQSRAGPPSPITPSPLPAGQIPAKLSAGSTPRTPPGAVRWALLVVAIAGLVGASISRLTKLAPKVVPLLHRIRR
jgi:ABC-type phosphate transport system substrate-binding protein